MSGFNLNYGSMDPSQLGQFGGLDYLNAGGYAPPNISPDVLAPPVGSYGMGMDDATGMDVPLTDGGGLFGNFLGTQTANGFQPGWGGMAISGLSALGNAYLGMKQYGLAKQTLAHNKNMFAKNFDAQKRTTNAQLEDRQRARVASNSGAYESVGSYMDRNGIR